MPIILMALVDTENGIGDGQGNRLYEIPNDTIKVLEVTVGKHVVMGRKTWDGLTKKPLPKRKNYVLSHNESFQPEGRTKVLRSIDEVLELAKGRDVYVLGGGEVFEQLMPHAEGLMLTHIHDEHPFANVFFPRIDVREWKLVRVKEHDASTEEGNKHPSYTFAVYKKRQQTEEK